MRTGPVCEVSPGAELSLWLPRSFKGVRISLGGQPLSAAERVSADGYRVPLTVPPGAGELRVDEPGRVTFRLPLAMPFRSAALDAASAAKDTGDYARALELLEPLRSQGAPLERLLADGLAARALLRQGHAEKAAELLAHTAPALFAAGQLSEGTRDAFARLYVLLHRLHRLDEAQRWFERFRAEARSYPMGRALEREHEGMLLASLGQASRALAAHASAERHYERLGQALEARRVHENRIGLWSDLGQVREAYAAHRALLPPPEGEHPCGKADLFIKQSWLAFLLLEEGELDRPREVAEALAAVQPWLEACGDPALRVIHEVNAGLFALEQADMARARASARALQDLTIQSPELEAWALDLRGRLALRQGRRAEARGHFQRELELGELVGSLDARLRALCGLAEASAAAGATAKARLKLGEALSLLEQAQHLAPLGMLGHTYQAARRSAAQRLVELLVAEEDVRGAFEVALSAYRSAMAAQARSRELDPASARGALLALSEYRRRRAALDAEILADWQHTAPERQVRLAGRARSVAELSRLLDDASRSLLASAPLDQAPAPLPGEYWLLTFPTSEGWLLFGTDGKRVELERWKPGAASDANAKPPALAREDTEPRLRAFEAQLAASRAVVIMAAGASRDWRFESFAVRGEPLAWRPLRFSAGIGPNAARPAAAARAAVIFDAARDLPYARREGALVRRALSIAPEQALEGDRATGHAVLSAFERSEHVHFAGHASSPDEAGGAALLLGRGARLEAWEFFALARAPAQVILSACNSGRGNRESLGPGWSLAQALIAAGAEAVLAPIESLRDGDAFALQERLYAELSRGVRLDQAFANVQRARAAEASAVFRLFTR